MFHVSIRCGAWLGWAFVTCLTTGYCEELQSRILQYRLDRLYFGSGKEANVFVGSPFVIVCNGDTIYEGCIEQSFMGVSYSDTTSYFFDTTLADSCYAVIEAADIDTLSPIKLGAVDFGPLTLLTKYLDNDTVTVPMNSNIATNTHGNEVSISQRVPFIDMVVSLKFGEIDGFFSYRSHASQMEDNRVIGTPAPFFVALVPNLSRKVNRGGLITTSMYYRFGESRLKVVFDGDKVHPMNCFYPVADNCRRPYPYEPNKGRGLLDHHPQRPRVLRIGVMSKSLEKLAFYFADVLSRDRVEVELVRSFEDADVYLAFVPIDEQNRIRSIHYIRDIFLRQKPSSTSMEEAQSIVENSLWSARAADSNERREYYCRMAEQNLMYDLGLFPLFRPTIFFHASEMLINYHFDDNCFLDLEALTKLKLPSPESRCNQ